MRACAQTLSSPPDTSAQAPGWGRHGRGEDVGSEWREWAYVTQSMWSVKIWKEA